MATIVAHPARERRHAVASRGEDARSFAAYLRDRPEPLDGVERALLRFDWVVRRLARRRSA